MWFFALVIVLLIGAVAVVASGRWGGMSVAYDDRPDMTVPGRQPLTGEDIQASRFAIGLRGYRMDEVDTLLDRLAYEITERDRRIATLERGSYAAEPTPAAVPEPPAAVPESPAAVADRAQAESPTEPAAPTAGPADIDSTAVRLEEMARAAANRYREAASEHADPPAEERVEDLAPPRAEERVEEYAPPVGQHRRATPDETVDGREAGSDGWFRVEDDNADRPA